MIIDIIALFFGIIAVFKGYSKGLIMAIFSFVSLIIGLAAAMKLSQITAAYMADSLHITGKWLPVVAFALTFFLAAFLVRIGGKMLEKFFQITLLGWANRLGGIVFFGLLYAIILSIVVFYAKNLYLLQDTVLQKSIVWPHIQPIGPFVMGKLGVIMPWFSDMFESLKEYFGGLELYKQK